MKLIIILMVTATMGFHINKSLAHPGIGIVIDSQGNVYYTDLNHVWKISQKGEVTIAVQDVHTHELYLDEHDNLYGEHSWYNGDASDTWGNYVWRLSADGILEKTTPEVEGFLKNNTLVRDRNNNSFYSEKRDAHEVILIESAGNESSLYSSHLFTDIRWMYFSKHDNNLYVVDCLAIKKVSSSGHVTVLANNLKEGHASFAGVTDRHYVYGIWTDSRKCVLVAVFGSGKVKKICASGKIKTIFESEDGWSPCGGLIGRDEDMWLLEFSSDNSARVRRIESDGSHTVYNG